MEPQPTAVQHWHVYPVLFAVFWAACAYFDSFLASLICSVCLGFAIDVLAKLVPAEMVVNLIGGQGTPSSGQGQAAKAVAAAKKESAVFYDKPLPPVPPPHQTEPDPDPIPTNGFKQEVEEVLVMEAEPFSAQQAASHGHGHDEEDKHRAAVEARSHVAQMHVQDVRKHHDSSDSEEEVDGHEKATLQSERGMEPYHESMMEKPRDIGASDRGFHQHQQETSYQHHQQEDSHQHHQQETGYQHHQQEDSHQHQQEETYHQQETGHLRQQQEASHEHKQGETSHHHQQEFGHHHQQQQATGQQYKDHSDSDSDQEERAGTVAHISSSSSSQGQHRDEFKPDKATESRRDRHGSDSDEDAKNRRQDDIAPPAYRSDSDSDADMKSNTRVVGSKFGEAIHAFDDQPDVLARHDHGPSHHEHKEHKEETVEKNYDFDSKHESYAKETTEKKAHHDYDFDSSHASYTLGNVAASDAASKSREEHHSTDLFATSDDIKSRHSDLLFQRDSLEELAETDSPSRDSLEREHVVAADPYGFKLDRRDDEPLMTKHALETTLSGENVSSDPYGFKLGHTLSEDSLQDLAQDKQHSDVLHGFQQAQVSTLDDPFGFGDLGHKEAEKTISWQQHSAESPESPKSPKDLAAADPFDLDLDPTKKSPEQQSANLAFALDNLVKKDDSYDFLQSKLRTAKEQMTELLHDAQLDSFKTDLEPEKSKLQPRFSLNDDDDDDTFATLVDQQKSYESRHQKIVDEGDPWREGGEDDSDAFEMRKTSEETGGDDVSNRAIFGDEEDPDEHDLDGFSRQGDSVSSGDSDGPAEKGEGDKDTSGKHRKKAEDPIDINLNDPQVKEAVVKIQAAFKGYKTRSQLKSQK